jgi:NTE family protein
MPPLAQFADELNTDLFSADGLAVPIAVGPTASRFAAGLDRTLVLGGGGEYYVAWYCGFFHGLFEQGVDAPTLAEMIVGTSAGSYVGSSMATGHFQRLRTEFDFFGHFPSLFARLAPVTEPNVSQMRAQKINAAAKDGSLTTLRTIGRAALAADNRLNGPAVERVAALLTGDSRTSWPSSKMHTTAAGIGSEEQYPARPWCGRKLVSARTHWSHAPGATLLHGRRHVLEPGTCRCRGRFEARPDRHAQ